MNAYQESLRITELQNEIEKINVGLWIYPYTYTDEEGQLITENEGFDYDLNTSEIWCDQQLLKSKFFELFIHTYRHFMEVKSIDDIDWKNLLDSFFELKWYGFVDIDPIVSKLKATNPHNWSKEIK